MDKTRVGLLFGGVVWLVASLIIVLSILQGGLISYMKIIALVFPAIFILMLNFRRYWHVLLLAFLTAEMLVIPIYWLRKFTIELILFGALSIMYVLDQVGYDDWCGLDLFPYRDDPIKFMTLSVENLNLAKSVVNLMKERGAEELRAQSGKGPEMSILIRDCIREAR